jgi:hypothetical protein
LARSAAAITPTNHLPKITGPAGQTAPLIEGRFFVLVVRRPGNCAGCDNLQAIDAAGNNPPANYGP